MSTLHRVTVDDGSLVEMLTGLEAWRRAFDRVLERHAPALPLHAEAAEGDPAVLEALLGLVALRDRFVALTASLPAPQREAEAAPPPPGSLAR